jgi:hypothetical protein
MSSGDIAPYLTGLHLGLFANIEVSWMQLLPSILTVKSPAPEEGA